MKPETLQSADDRNRDRQKPGINRLTRDQWMVLAAAFFGWLFDGFEIGLFPVIARPALKDMFGAGGDAFAGDWMGRITAAFLIGAALGGGVFGWLGDRIGRVRALTLSILTYSIFSGAGYFAHAPWHLALFRFLAAIGMGGEWAVGVALVMECWPDKYRPLLAGVIGAAANVGIFLVAFVARLFTVTSSSWRWMFLVGASPALLTFLIRLFVPESEKWKTSVSAGKSKPMTEIFSPTMRKRTLIGIGLAAIALIGTWGSVQWIPLWTDQITGGKLPHAKANAQMFSAIGAVAGCLFAPIIGRYLSRRGGFFTLCLSSLVICAVLFRGFTGYSTAFLWVVGLTGCATAAFYGWFPLYFPELFPTSIRATGQGVCYNFGRIIAAVGVVMSGQMVRLFEGNYARMGSIITLIYLVGMLVIWFAPETKGKPLPD
jgi:SHS family sialic acid transporter-like MFS transporter